MKRKYLMLSRIILLLILTITGCSSSINYDTTQKQIYKQKYNAEQKQTFAKRGPTNTISIVPDAHLFTIIEIQYYIS